MSTRQKNRISTNAKYMIAIHFICSILPVVIPIVLGFTVSHFYVGIKQCILSPHEFLSNLSSVITSFLGFMITFIVVALGLASSNSMKSIFRNPALKWEYIFNMFVPIISGFLLLALIVWLSAVISGTGKVYFPKNECIIFLSFVFSFVCSVLKCIFCFFKIMNQIANES